MTDIIKQLNAISMTNTYKLHDLLDNVLGIEFMTFPESEIKFDADHVSFTSQIGEYRAIVQRDMNAFTVVTRIVKDSDIVAECVISVDGQFNEKYARMNAEIKNRVSAWFTAIGEIDVTTLQSSEPDEAESEAPAEAEAEEAIPEATEAEVVSEGEAQ